MKTSRIILLAAIALFAVVLAMNFSKNTTLYTTFATAKQSGRTVHVVGEWVEREASQYDPQRDLFRFALRDTTGNVAWVHYRDPKPDNFEHAERVVIIGAYKQDVFEADKIVMKCPSKYEDTNVQIEQPKSL